MYQIIFREEKDRLNTGYNGMIWCSPFIDGLGLLLNLVTGKVVLINEPIGKLQHSIDLFIVGIHGGDESLMTFDEVLCCLDWRLIGRTRERKQRLRNEWQVIILYCQVKNKKRNDDRSYQSREVWVIILYTHLPKTCLTYVKKELLILHHRSNKSDDYKELVS